MLAPRSRYLTDPGPTFWASLRYFSLTRLVIACVLVGAVVLSRGQVDLGQTDPALFLRSSIAYLVLATVVMYFAEARRTRFYLQLALQLVLDLVAVTVMMHASDGARGGLAVLYLLPVAGAAILSPPLLALGFAAFSTLLILAEALWHGLDVDLTSAGLVQAGLYGAACFAIAIVLNRLAARLIAQENISAVRARDLERQIEINRLVVADMQDGVLVLAADGSPRALNPAAARMLRIPDPDRLLREGWAEQPAGRLIHDRFLAWIEQALESDDGFEIEMGQEDRGEREILQKRLRARFVALEPQPQKIGDHVVFLEDMQRVDERAQQLKLASMGRLTASIAHEIRNPLAAISHASALLAEGQLAEADQRLLHIVHDNTRRLDRIVENILQLSRRGPVQAEDVALVPFIDDLVIEFCRDHGFDPRAIDVSIYREPTLRFNPEHLRQVMINLMQNARRHASGSPGSISVIVVPVVPGTSRLGRDGDATLQREVERIELIVQDDGMGIDSETRHHLFEPFFTTHHRGTGLGLYLARELCLANGATLGYVPNADPSKKGGFVVNAAGQLSENDQLEQAKSQIIHE